MINQVEVSILYDDLPLEPCVFSHLLFNFQIIHLIMKFLKYFILVFTVYIQSDFTSEHLDKVEKLSSRERSLFVFSCVCVEEAENLTYIGLRRSVNNCAEQIYENAKQYNLTPEKDMNKIMRECAFPAIQHLDLLEKIWDLDFAHEKYNGVYYDTRDLIGLIRDYLGVQYDFNCNGMPEMLNFDIKKLSLSNKGDCDKLLALNYTVNVCILHIDIEKLGFKSDLDEEEYKYLLKLISCVRNIEKIEFQFKDSIIALLHSTSEINQSLIKTIEENSEFVYTETMNNPDNNKVILNN